MKSFFASTFATLCVTVAISAWYFPLSGDFIDPEVGRAVFSSKCAACHAVSQNASASYGPNLAEVYKRSKASFPEISPEQYILNSILDPDAVRDKSDPNMMPVDTSDDLSRSELLSLVAFLCSQEEHINFRDIQALKIKRLTTEINVRTIIVDQAEKGRGLFYGKYSCSSCHPLDGRPGSTFLAPSLLQAGLHKPEYLKASVKTPNLQLNPLYAHWTILNDGRVVTGRRFPSEDDSISLLEYDKSDGFHLRNYSTENLEQVDGDEYALQSSVSAMPDYSKLLTDEDLNALVAFLQTLK